MVEIVEKRVHDIQVRQYNLVIQITLAATEVQIIIK